MTTTRYWMVRCVYWMIVGCVVTAVLLWLSIFAGAQTAPTLSEVNQLKLQNRVLAFQLAQVQLDKARGEIESLLKDLQQPGYDLDIQTLTYQPKKTESKPADSKP